MAIRILRTDLRMLEMHTRMPFRYGIATLTALPHLFVRIDAEIDGVVTTGIASDGLAPKWFTKNPATSTDEDIAGMVEVIEAACGFACSIGAAATVFDLWHALYRAQDAWGSERGHPPLLSGFGTSLVERALIDAFCRARGTTFAIALRDDSLGTRLEVLHPELAGTRPADFLSEHPLSTIRVRHTVGLSDPIVDADIEPAERLDDGLPQSLAACIRSYGLTHFKIKLSGDAERDRARLRQIADVLGAESLRYAVTLDGNEQFHDVEGFRALWEALAQDALLAPLLERLIFVEQPIHRDLALDAATMHGFARWKDGPPIIIDESDATLASLRQALACGYAGTSHKNCKGIFKGVANSCLLAQLQRSDPGKRYIFSGEDLANVGPVALLQDLAVMATLGIEHVERNGHHYFAGLSMYPKDVQEQVLRQHHDLYTRSTYGFATLDIREGAIVIDSVVQAPFGLQWSFNSDAYPPLARRGISQS